MCTSMVTARTRCPRGRRSALPGLEPGSDAGQGHAEALGKGVRRSRKLAKGLIGGLCDQRRLVLQFPLPHWKSCGWNCRPPAHCAYFALNSGLRWLWWPTFPQRDICEHSQNSARRSITPPCQNRGPAKDERKTVWICPRVGGQRHRRQQPRDPAPGVGRLRAGL